MIMRMMLKYQVGKKIRRPGIELQNADIKEKM